MRLARQPAHDRFAARSLAAFECPAFAGLQLAQPSADGVEQRVQLRGAVLVDFLAGCRLLCAELLASSSVRKQADLMILSRQAQRHPC